MVDRAVDSPNGAKAMTKRIRALTLILAGMLIGWITDVEAQNVLLRIEARLTGGGAVVATVLDTATPRRYTVTVVIPTGATLDIQAAGRALSLQGPLTRTVIVQNGPLPDTFSLSVTEIR